MEQTSKNVNLRDSQNRFNTPLVEVTRTFNAPVERVWEAWSNVELTKQWWGPEGFTCPEGKIDFREGGKYQLAMKSPDGKVIWSGGQFEEIAKHKKIVWTDQFQDREGNVLSAKKLDMPGEWVDTLYVTIRFENLGDNRTRVSLKHEGIPREMHDECVQGWDSSFNKLQKLVERN